MIIREDDINTHVRTTKIKHVLHCYS